MTPVEPAAVRPATPADLDELCALQVRLFEEDAGVHEKYADITWPEREGHADFERLLDSEESLVLIAEAGGACVGFLAGYLVPSPPTRQPVIYAVLRSLYVLTEHRGQQAGSALTNAFIAWGKQNGAAEAQVHAYAANTGAQRFYERHGFVSQSVQRTLPLTS